MHFVKKQLYRMLFFSSKLLFCASSVAFANCGSAVATVVPTAAGPEGPEREAIRDMCIKFTLFTFPPPLLVLALLWYFSPR